MTCYRRYSAVRGYFALFLAFCFPSTGFAQAARRDVRPPVRLEFEHDGRDVSGFALYVFSENSLVQRFDLGRLTPARVGVFEVNLPVLAPGRYRVEVAAYNLSGEGPHTVLPEPLVIEDSARSAVRGVSPAPQTAPRSESSKPPEVKKPAGGGGLRKMWRVVVGSDD